MELHKETKALVVGLGKSGMAAVRYLHRQGLRVAASDSRPLASLPRQDLDLLHALNIELETGEHTARLLEDGCLVVPSPGVPLDLPLLNSARQRNCLIVGELALAADRLPVPVIGVTGTNGKTTVTSLIGEILKADGRRVFVGGNIGTPVLEFLLDPGQAEVAVLELSSFQLEISGAFRPEIAIFLNLSPDHLDRHGTMANYAAAKGQIFVNQNPNDVAILGADDALVMEAATTAKTGRQVLFGHGPQCEAQVKDTEISLNLAEVTENYDLTGTRLTTYVNRLNAAAAVLAARMFGCRPENIRRGLADYQVQPHRMNLVTTCQGVRYIDDSKATNIGAVIAALAGCDGPVVLIAGGRDKASDFTLLRESVAQRVKHLLLIGEASAAMAAALDSLVPTEKMTSMAQAVQRAAMIATAGDIVLLAPGCASFDMFSGYAERGRVYSQAVRELTGQMAEEIQS